MTEKASNTLKKSIGFEGISNGGRRDFLNSSIGPHTTNTSREIDFKSGS
jgi:hypothetical protein